MYKINSLKPGSSTLVWSHRTPHVPMTAAKIFKVGIIIGSQRVVRVGPQAADFVLDTIKAAGYEASADTTLRPQITFDLIDIPVHNLPNFENPASQTKSSRPRTTSTNTPA